MNNENILELKKQVHALEGALFELASPFRYNIPVEVFGEVLERHGVKGHEFGPGVRKPEPQQELMDLKKQAHALEGALFELVVLQKCRRYDKLCFYSSNEEEIRS